MRSHYSIIILRRFNLGVGNPSTIINRDPVLNVEFDLF